MRRKHFYRILIVSLLWTASSGCTSAYKKSLGGDTQKVFSTVYLTDFDAAWLSVLDSVKSLPIDNTNRETGFILTKWLDNTASKNFAESFGQQQNFFRAQYRIRAVVSKNTYYNNSPATKVSFYKEQLVQFDPLEDWIPQETDGIEEKTLLYRTGRLLYIRNEIAKIEQDQQVEEEAKTKAEVDDKKASQGFEDFAEFEFREGDKREEGYEGGDEDFQSLKKDMELDEWINESDAENRVDEEFENLYYDQ